MSQKALIDLFSLEAMRNVTLAALMALAPPDLAAIAQLEQRWLACEIAGHADALLELCCPDVVWLPPGRPPIRGKAAVREWLASSRDRIDDIDITRVAIDGHGFGAYKIASFRTRCVPCGSNEAVTLTGWHLWVLERSVESGWRVATVVWSLA